MVFCNNRETAGCRWPGAMKMLSHGGRIRINDRYNNRKNDIFVLISIKYKLLIMQARIEMV